MILYRIADCKTITKNNAELVFKPTWIGKIFGIAGFSEQYFVDSKGNWRNTCDGTAANTIELKYLESNA